MSDEPQEKLPGGDHEFVEEMARKTALKLKGLREGQKGVWFGLGMSGLIGWSVAVPTLAGALFGLWLDHRHPSSHSWALSLMVAGIALGSFNAWHWLTQQDKDMNDDSGGDNG